MLGDTGESTFVVLPDNAESYEVTVDLRDVRLWERTSPRNTLRKFAENPSADDIFSLVHIAIKRQRIREVPPLAEWIDVTRVRVKAEPVGGLLDRNELIAVIEKTVGYDDGLSVTIANDVMNLLESLPGREPDPTRTGH
ncbi:MAG: hypothetical protein ACRDSP_13750 [Pseudonocardiaceae bacterium]